MKHNYVAVYENVTLRPLYERDIEKLRQWRNDPSKTKFLRNIGRITKEQQKDWYSSYLNTKSELIFAIVENSIAMDIVGSLSIYNINGEVADIGRILIGDDRVHGMGIGRIALVIAMTIGFSKLGLTNILSDVSPNNKQAFTNDMRVGFKVIGEHYLDSGIYEKEISIDFDTLKKANDYVDQIRFYENGNKFYVGQ